MKVFDLHGHQQGLLASSEARDVPLGEFKGHGVDASVVCAVGDPHSFGLESNSFALVEQQLQQILSRSSSNSLKAVTATKELDSVWAQGKTAIFLGVEGGDFITDLSLVDRLYELGVRVLAPVHYSDNQFGTIGFHLDGSGPSSDDGLTKAGAALIAHAQDIGMVIDVAHGSDQLIVDACKIAKKPLLCSHGGLRDMYDTKRFMDEAAANSFRDNGGLLGVWPCRFGLVGATSRKELVDIILQTIDFLGWDRVGYCTDVNGAPGYPPDYRGVQDTRALLAALAEASSAGSTLEHYSHANMISLLQSWGV